MRILALDLSTTCTGVALFDTETHPQLIQTYKLKSSTLGTSKMCKLEKTLVKMERLAEQILALIEELSPDQLVIEEIAGSRSRLTQKTLDGFHWILYAKLASRWLPRVDLYDVTGSAGWRTDLRLKLSEADKAANKEAKVLNRRLGRGQQIAIIGPKHLSCRYANAKYGLALNVDQDSTDGDIADAVSLGDAWIKFKFTKSK